MSVDSDALVAAAHVLDDLAESLRAEFAAGLSYLCIFEACDRLHDVAECIRENALNVVPSPDELLAPLEVTKQVVGDRSESHEIAPSLQAATDAPDPTEVQS